MIKYMREPTLKTLGLGTVLEIFSNGKLPVNTGELVDDIFGNPGDRGSVIISGANGIVGAGKLMQLGSRLQPYGIPIIGLDFPGAPDGIGAQYQGLLSSFGSKRSAEIMQNVIRMNYDGTNLPVHLNKFKPKFLLEAIPEILEIKKSHFDLFQKSFPELEIRSVTSGFPSSELGVGIAHPAFPHQINKIFEIVETEPSRITKLLWGLGLIPVPVSDHWSFVLDVLFCGLMLSSIRYHEATNMPFWKIDKYIRKYFGPNPFRAHDVIGAKGANFLTWSCLQHLGLQYGGLFTPSDKLIEHKDSGDNWYPLNHLRPMVNWSLDNDGLEELQTWILGSLIQMMSLMLKENRSHLSHINSIGEICAQFRIGVPALIRNLGSDKIIKLVENYQKLHIASSNSPWYHEVFSNINSPEWNQLYVNAEHDGKIGVITIGRESYNQDVDNEMNRAIDWLRKENIDRVIVTGDFHLTTQLVGADTTEFFPALTNTNEGFRISNSWSKTARRLNDEFRVSVGFINGKRCLGGMLELLTHCHYLISLSDADLGAPEVNLPVVPGMEMCHLTFRKAKPIHWNKILHLLLNGKSVKASETVGWLTDYTGTMENAIKIAGEIVSNGENAMPKREINTVSITGILFDIPGINETDNKSIFEARNAIINCIKDSCGATWEESINVQSKHSAEFMMTKSCQRGFVGSEAAKIMNV